MTSQTIELDADCFAANIGMQMLDLSLKNQNTLHPEMRQFYSNWPDMLKYWHIASYTSKRLFGFDSTQVSKFRDLSHPLTGLRQHINFSTIVSIFLTKNDKLFAEKSAIIGRDAAFAVESAFESISQQTFNADSFMFAYTPEGMRHVQLLSKNWNNVRPLLEPFSFCEASLFICGRILRISIFKVPRKLLFGDYRRNQRFFDGIGTAMVIDLRKGTLRAPFLFLQGALFVFETMEFHSSVFR